MYLSEHERFDDFGNEGALVWHENSIPYAVWGHDSTRSLSFKYYPSEVLLIYYLHIAYRLFSPFFSSWCLRVLM